MLKRARSLLILICCLVLVALAGLAESDKHFTMAGFDGEESRHNWETNGFFSRMEERTGIDFTFEEYTDASKWQAAKENMFQTGQMPDVLFKAELTTEEMIRYTDSGQLIDLLPLLQENAPNLWALLSENPEWLQAVTLPNGKVGALPTLTTLPAQNAMWINRRWLDELKLDMPTDAESLRQVLLAFGDKDPNKNGKKDEIPLAFLGAWDLKFLSHAFGLSANDYNIFVDDQGTIRYAPLESNYRDFITWLREMYRDKLLDQNGFYTVDTLRGTSDKDEAVTYGVFFGPNPMTLYTYIQAEQYVLLPPLSFGGKQVYRDLCGGEVVRGTFAITSACEDPATLLLWVDFLYTEEGAVRAMVGEKDKDYEVDAEGHWQWVGGVENLSSEQLYDNSVYDTGNMPWLFPVDFYGKYQEASVRRIHSDLQSLQSYIVKPFPEYSLTEEQRAYVLPLQDELGRYVDECLAQFVLGQREISEESFAAFEAGLKERGAQEMTAFWQGVYDEMIKE